MPNLIWHGANRKSHWRPAKPLSGIRPTSYFYSVPQLCCVINFFSTKRQTRMQNAIKCETVFSHHSLFNWHINVLALMLYFGIILDRCRNFDRCPCNFLPVFDTLSICHRPYINRTELSPALTGESSFFLLSVYSFSF